MEPQFVPSTLFPISDRGINEEWASKTYRYRCIFFSHDQYVIPTAHDISAWINDAKDLCNKLRDFGTARAEKQIVLMCNNFYNERLGGNKFKNIYDVVSMMSSRSFFEQNYEFYLDLLHMFQYGIFRCAGNAWALDAANDWMVKYNIKYDDTNSNSFKDQNKVRRKGKGFVYKLLVSRASNTLCVRFQKLTRRLFRQYVIVRDRQFKRLTENSEIEKRRFNLNYDGYVIKLDNYNNEMEKQMHLEYMPKINSMIRKALDNGNTYDAILDHLRVLTGNNAHKGNCIYSLLLMLY